MKRIIYMFIFLVFILVLTGCDDVKGNGTLKCNNDIYDYQISYSDGNVKMVNLLYKDYNYDKKLENDKLIDQYYSKYCGKSYDGYSCSVSLMSKYVYVRTIYDFDKLSDDDLDNLEKIGLIYNYRKVDKLRSKLEDKIDKIECEYKENKAK